MKKYSEMFNEDGEGVGAGSGSSEPATSNTSDIATYAKPLKWPDENSKDTGTAKRKRPE